MKPTIISIFFLAGIYSSFVLSDDPSIKYSELFNNQVYKQLVKALSVSPDFKDVPSDEIQAVAREQADYYTKCHMMAMEAYSSELKSVAYQAANSGGSYAEAKMAFDSALSVEGAAGGAREEAVSEMVLKAAEIGQECMGG